MDFNDRMVDAAERREMNSRYKVTFFRQGIDYGARYAKTLSHARALVWRRYSGLAHHAPVKAKILVTRDEPYPGRTPKWTVAEEWARS
jgi:hypothetical protein